MRAQLRIAHDRPGACAPVLAANAHGSFPELAPLAVALRGRDVLLDGELVCLDLEGRPNFHRLRRRLSAVNARAKAWLANQHP